ncbi:MAG: hypothetical protein BWY72_01511 [Bacteroidetes bacterium ADurb.Bin416]|nr:MAG: hypothetical protein BWY72_01511 [Bacteroidetes bacterium ADurb.Bin416]
MLGYETAAVGILGHQFVAGREIKQQIGAIERLVTAGGYRHPQVFAQFHPHANVAVAEQEVGAKRYPLTTEGGFIGQHIMGRCKPAFFVKFVVIGQPGLGNNGQDTPLLHGDGHVHQSVLYPQGHAHQGHDGQIGGFPQQAGQCIFGCINKGLLVKKVAAGVPGQSHFGKAHDLHVCCCSLSHEGHRLFNVVGTICYLEQGDGRSHPDKSVVHGRWFYRHKCTFLCQ